MFEVLVLVVALLFLCLLSYVSGMPRVNAITVASGVWGPVLFVSAWPGFVEPEVASSTIRFLAVGLISLCVGALVPAVVAGWGKMAPPREHRTVNWSAAYRWHRVCTWILLIHALLQVYQALPLIEASGGFSALFEVDSSSAGAYKIEATKVAYLERQADFTPTSFVLGIANYCTFLGFFSIFTGSLLWLRGERIRAMLPLLIAAAFSFVSLQRTTFAMTALLMLYSVVLFRAFLPNGTIAQPRRWFQSTASVGAAIVVATVVLLVPLQLRNAGTDRTTGFQSLIQYFAGSVSGLNNRFVAGGGELQPPLNLYGSPGPYPGYGAYTLTNAAGIVDRLGFAVAVPPKAYDFSNSFIAGSRFTTNTATSFYDYYLDFGLLGLIGIPLVIGAITTVMQMRPGRSVVGRVPLAAVLLTTITWSFFVNSLLRDVRYAFLVGVATLALTRWSGIVNARQPTVETPDGVTMFGNSPT